jgi:glycosyltransferase involved in cell wall biosynthesis
MKVLIHHPVRLPAHHYGGTERVVMWLTRGLIARGHEVYVVALRGSVLPSQARLVPANPDEHGYKRIPELLKREGVSLEEIDIIHSMAPIPSDEIEFVGRPFVQTIHGNGKPGEIFHDHSVFLSKDHARRHGGKHFVYNGLDPSEIRLRSTERSDDFLFFSKTNWKVKNLAGALRVARQANVRLRVAGGRGPISLRWQAFLQGADWVGAVSDADKSAFFESGRALLFPVLWPEPFGLVVVESLLSGTPVLASRVGSLPELIPDGAGVGELISPDDEAAWVEAIGRVKLKNTWKKDVCRKWAEENFHFQKMSEGYEKIYVRIREGERL